MSKTILVTGDSVCDHNYYRGNRATADSPEPRGFRLARTGGGALFLKDLIKEVMRGESEWQTEFGLSEDYESLPPTHHAFCLWEPQVRNPEEKDPDKQVKVWRAVEPPLGYGHPESKTQTGDPPTKKSEALCGRHEPLKLAPDIIVIDDAGLGFRSAQFQKLWPFSNVGPSLSWIAMKLTGLIGASELWKAVVSGYREKLVLIVSADQLRQGNVRISRGLSWEVTMEDLTAEFRGNPALQPLLEARHLIVTFGADGAFWLDNKTDAKSSALVFDAARAEGEWAEHQGKGSAFGYLSCFTAAIVRELCRAGEKPDLEAALSVGLGASRELRRSGHGEVEAKKAASNSDQKAPEPTPGFPFGKIAARICLSENEARDNGVDKYVSALIPQNPVDRGNWMMLDEWQVHARTGAKQRPHFEAAHAVAVLGPEALERFPVARFGGLQTVDRKEIESLRTIRRLIRDYEGARRQKNPLNIGVFGPPGAGKSFGVKEIAKAVLGENVEILTFNLSQFGDTQELNGALHQVRDKVLSGNTPVVFWDEFDALGYKWLHYLLAPMQDGSFQDGQISHPIGKCVFVFAGATSPTFEAFGPRNPDELPSAELKAVNLEQLRDLENRWLDFVLKKGPDFKSRLVGYLNVLGPNPRQRCEVKNGRRFWEDDVSDLCYPIRRALFIRSQFKVKEGKRLKLDPGVLCALLEVRHYKAGSRSLEFLCQHLQQNASGIPSRSNLPGQQLLKMHVDADEFWELCERDLEFAPAAIQLAQGLHEDWLRTLTKEQRATNSFAVPWDKLGADTQSSNLAQAARIPTVVALAGLRVVRNQPPKLDREVEVRQKLQAHAEVLAEAEHNHWMVERMLAGWRYARLPKKDTVRKLHPLLIPFAQLTKLEKDKDHRVVKGQKATPTTPEIPDYIERVKRVGFRIELASQRAD